MKIEKEVVQMFLTPHNETENVLLSYQSLMSLPKEEMDKYGISRETIMDGRDLIVKSIVNKQLAKNNEFCITTPFENPCTECHGAGSLFKCSRKKIEVDCRDCDGTGHRSEVECKSCDKDGRFIRNQGGVKINVICKNCKGTKKPICRTCWGNKKVKVTVLKAIESTTRCPKCKGVGFFKPKSNPVLDKTLADAIKDKIDEKHITSLVTDIQDATFEPKDDTEQPSE